MLSKSSLLALPAEARRPHTADAPRSPLYLILLFALTAACADGSTDGSAGDGGSTTSLSATGATQAPDGTSSETQSGTTPGEVASSSTSTATSTGDPSTGGMTTTTGSTTDDPTTGPPTTTGTSSTTGDPLVETLLELPGDVFTPTEEERAAEWKFGSEGTAYARLTLSFDIEVGGWQPEIPDAGKTDRTEHILFGLFRDNQPKSYLRYLMGTAAVSFDGKAPHFRMFGRKDLEAGYMSYTSWSGTYPWKQGSELHVECDLDGEEQQQRCVLELDGETVAERSGIVAYLDPAAHLASGFTVELGADPPNEIENSPIGWTYSNLKIVAHHL